MPHFVYSQSAAAGRGVAAPASSTIRPNIGVPNRIAIPLSFPASNIGSAWIVEAAAQFQSVGWASAPASPRNGDAPVNSRDVLTTATRHNKIAL